MSGKRTKALRRALFESGLKITAHGWRLLKNEWTATPRPERSTTTAVDLVDRLRKREAARLERHLRRLPRGKLESIYRRLMGRR